MGIRRTVKKPYFNCVIKTSKRKKQNYIIFYIINITQYFFISKLIE